MKFTEMQLKEAVERSTLKIAVICLSVMSLTFSILLTLDLSKDAVVVERACETQILDVKSAAQTEEEIKNFLKEAISLRFDSIVSRDPSSYMVQDVFVARTKEQDELKRGGVDQRVIVRDVKLSGNHFLVGADRLVAIGKARSAIPITLTVQVASKHRSLTNPYGLVLTSIDQLKEGK